MKDFLVNLKKEPLFKIILTEARKNNYKIYLVGGILRDLVLGRVKEPLDYDFTIKRNAIRFGSNLARILKSGFVVLDKEHGSCRIVYRKMRNLTLDFTDFRGSDLNNDLLHRDFTLNCLCIDLQELVGSKKMPAALICDPYDGLGDIKKNLIRQVNPMSMLEDPVRIVRAFSLSAIFGFDIEKKTRSSIKKYREKLRDAAFERIRDELFKIFKTEDAYKTILELDKFKILQLIIPEIEQCYRIGQGPYHHLDVWRHSLQTLKELDKLLITLRGNKCIQEYLNQDIGSFHSLVEILKLTSLLHDIGKPKAKRRFKKKLIFHGHENIGAKMIYDIGMRLKLSSREIDSLKRMVRWHLRPGYLADLDPLSERAVFRFFRDAGKDAVAILLLSIADQRATKGRLTSKKSRVGHEKLCFKLIKDYFRKESEEPLVRLLNGDDVLKLGIQEGPAIGLILKEVEEAQGAGEIKTKEEAFCLAKEFLKKKPINKNINKK